MNPIFEQAKERFKGKKVLAVMSAKGGVGKSTIASLIALNLSEKHRTALIDLDIYGNSVLKLFGIQKLHEVGKEGIEPFKVGNLSIYSVGGLVGDHYIVLPGKQEGVVIESLLGFANVEENKVVIDTPPGMGEELLTLMRVTNPEIAVVTLPSKLSLKVVKQMLDYLLDSGLKPKVIIANMAFLESSREPIYPFGSLKEVYALGKEYEIMIKSLPIDPKLEDFVEKLQNYSGSLRKELKEIFN
ncbi:MAG: P-loop NTPase [Archaeoglobaceae archaeon]|nr:P-loop NTPase [Archaeoglobaceae archaeon]MDW8117783.1 P-loop NTPase [Archaeoglobaceae archaeon]